MNDYKPDNIDKNLSALFGDNVRKDLPKIKKILFDSNVSFFFVPSKRLKELVSKGEHPVIKKIPDGFKALIMSGQPHAIQKRMVYDFLAGKLDSDNSFVLRNGDIRVLEGNVSLLNEGETDGDKES